jgi:hypothetical protein
MSIEALQDFKFYSAVPDETIEKYQGLIPPELLEVWKEHGFGTFYGGYLKIVNPDDYQEILEESFFDSKVSIPIFTTGFGDIIIWRKSKYVTLIEYRKKDATVLSSGFDFFFEDLMVEGDSLIQELDKDLYDDAVSKYGLLEYNECFGFVPLLPLGGSEKVENLQKVQILPHIDFITQAVGRIE